MIFNLRNRKGRLNATVEIVSRNFVPKWVGRAGPPFSIYEQCSSLIRSGGSLSVEKVRRCFGHALVENRFRYLARETSIS